MYGGSRPPLTLDVGFPAVRSIADIKESVRARAATLKPGEWIRGNGWDDGYLDECLADPTRHMTRATSTRSRQTTPYTWWTSRSTSWLRTVGRSSWRVSPATPPPNRVGDRQGPATRRAHRQSWSNCRPGDPDAGGAAVDQGGEAGGHPRHDADHERARHHQRDRCSLGPGGIGYQGGLLGSECISVYNDLHNEEAMTVRVNVLYLFGEYGAISLQDFQRSILEIGIHSGFGDEWLQIGGSSCSPTVSLRPRRPGCTRTIPTGATAAWCYRERPRRSAARNSST